MNHANQDSDLKTRRALVSTFDKRELLELARFLVELDVELVASGGTASFLKENGFTTRNVTDLTGFPECLNGRVKTLHPKIHAGILADRSKTEHRQTLQAQDINFIDLVVCNFYPFDRASADQLANEESLIELIDIGGPAMVRSAAKNYHWVTVLCDPNDYASFMYHLKERGETTLNFRRQMASKAFSVSSAYDQAIARALKHLPSAEFAAADTLQGIPLRYGENPHQKATLETRIDDEIQLATTTPLQGKTLSYNNLLDADTALFALRCLIDGRTCGRAGAVVIKHQTPCGAALGETCAQALELALTCDKTSAFGGIIALSEEVTRESATLLAELFLELVLAPSFAPDALNILSQKKNLRLLSIANLMKGRLNQESIRSINGGLLKQSADQPFVNFPNLSIVTQRKPSHEERASLETAFRVVTASKSNAIALALPECIVSIAAGQTSRIDAVDLAIKKMRPLPAASPIAMGSDAFFPFADAVHAAAKANVRAIIQPGGSIRDSEVIAAADAHGITMAFTNERHFRH